jgi:DNA transposition AAA+ family ATPase
MAEVLEMGEGKMGPGSGWSKERQLLWKLLYEEGAKQDDVAKSINKSRTAVSLYARGVSPDRAEFRPKVREYLKSIKYWQEDVKEVEDQQGDFVVDPAEIGFIETDDYRRVTGVCEMSSHHREFGIVIGAPGTGKTCSMEKYLENNPKSVLVTCDEMSTIKSVLIDTADAIGVPAWGSAATIARRIIRELRNRPRLLIFDEADMLKRTSLLEALRGIYDKARTVGVVLCGNQTLAQRIMEIAEDRPELARIRDRVGIYVRLQGLSAEEAEQFLARVNLTSEAKKILIEVGKKRGIRRLAKAVGRLLEITNGEIINEDLVTELDHILLSFNE